MFVNKKIDVSIAILVMIVTTLISFYIAYNTTHAGYKNLFLLPLVYGLMYVIFIAPIRNRLNNIYIHTFIAVSFTRYVILPLLITVTSFYGGRSSVPPMDSFVVKGIYLMCYEIIVISIISYLVFNKINPKRIINNTIQSPPSIFIYILYMVVTSLLAIAFPESLKIFGFLKVSDSYIGGNENSLIINIVTYMLIIMKFLIFVLILNKLFQKYQDNKKNIYIVISFLVVLLNISVFFGDNRADFIITAIASILLFQKLYPKSIKFLIIPFIIVLIILVSLINDHRNHASITNGENPLIDLTGTLQVYLAGPYNVAIALEATEINENERKPLNLIHELLRPVIGINILLKEFDINSSSNYFNERIYFSDHVSQIIPSIGQGYFYLGFLFSPIITILYILLAKIFIIQRGKQTRIDLYFFLSIPIARIGFSMAQNGSILANDISFFLVLFIFLYFLNNKIFLKYIKSE